MRSNPHRQKLRRLEEERKIRPSGNSNWFCSAGDRFVFVVKEVKDLDFFYAMIDLSKYFPTRFSAHTYLTFTQPICNPNSSLRWFPVCSV